MIHYVRFDDREYAVEDLGDSLTVTRVTGSGTGLFVDVDEAASVVAGLDDGVAVVVGLVA